MQSNYQIIDSVTDPTILREKIYRVWSESSLRNEQSRFLRKCINAVTHLITRVKTVLYHAYFLNGLYYLRDVPVYERLPQSPFFSTIQ